jgi:hypothetical protein
MELSGIWGDESCLQAIACSGSSADVGDAHLVNTEPCETLQEAIAALKAKILELFQAFS